MAKRGRKKGSKNTGIARRLNPKLSKPGALYKNPLYRAKKAKQMMQTLEGMNEDQIRTVMENAGDKVSMDDLIDLQYQNELEDEKLTDKQIKGALGTYIDQVGNKNPLQALAARKLEYNDIKNYIPPKDEKKYRGLANAVANAIWGAANKPINEAQMGVYQNAFNQNPLLNQRPVKQEGQNF